MSNRAQGARRMYSREELLEHIQRLADGDTPPTRAEFRADDAAPTATTVKTRFGSWNEAVDAAGFSPRPPTNRSENRTSAEEIIEHIQRLADGDTPPTKQEFDDDGAAPSSMAVRNYFARWNEAVVAAGFGPREKYSHGSNGKISREELLEWLVAYRREFAEWPTYRLLSEWPGPSIAPYRREFGTLSEAIEAAAEVEP